MKRVINYSWVVLLTFMLVSCSEKSSFTPDTEYGSSVDISFNVKSVPAAGTATETSFQIGDEVGLFVTVRNDNATPVYPDAENCIGYNLKLVMTETGLGPADENNVITWDESGKIYDFFAYYPYREEVSDPNEIIGRVNISQNVNDNFRYSDFMVAQNIGGLVNTRVELLFGHMLSLVEVEIDTDRTDINSVSVENVSVGYKANISEENATVDGAEDKEKIQMNKSRDNLFYVVLPPQTIPAGSRIFTLSIGEDVWTVSCENDVVLSQGEVSRHKITLQEQETSMILYKHMTAFN